MKKKTIYLILFLSMFIVNIVNGEAIQENNKNFNLCFDKNGVYQGCYDTNGFEINEKDAYCINPGVDYATTDCYNSTLAYDSSSIPKSNSEIIENAYWVGVASILSNDDYQVALASLRSYNDIWKLKSQNLDNNYISNRINQNYVDIYTYFVYKDIANFTIFNNNTNIEKIKEIKNICEKLNGSCEGLINTNEVSNKFNNNSYKLDLNNPAYVNFLDNIKQNISNALDEVINYLNKNDDKNIDNINNNLSFYHDENSNGKYVVTYKLTISSDDFNLKFECEDCKNMSINYNLYNDVNGKSQKLTDGYLSKNSTLELKKEYDYLTITFEKSNLGNECTKVNYKLFLEKNNNSLSMANQNKVYRYTCSNNGANYQELYVLDDDDNTSSVIQSINRYAEICPEDEIKESCTAYVSTTSCNLPADDEDEIIIKEGVHKKDNGCASNDEVDIAKCIIENEDVNGNSYLSNYAFIGDKENRYCKVYCKEDYHITLPGLKETESGRYFSLKLGIEGTKSCFTDKIDKAGFEKDLEEVRKKVIDAWNEWNRWYQGTKSPDPIRKVQTASACCGGGTYTWDGYVKKWDYNVFGYNGGISTLDEQVADLGSANCVCNMVNSTCENEETGEKHPCKICGTGSCSPRSGSADVVKSKINAKLGIATENLQSAIKNFLDILNEYNSCSGAKTQFEYYNNIRLDSNKSYGWKSEYNLDKVNAKFSYDEEYMGFIKDRNTMEKIINDDTTSNFKTLVCNDEYECSEKDVKFETYNYFMCWGNGSTYDCGIQEFDVLNTSYISETKTVTQDFTSPSLFNRIPVTSSIVLTDKATDGRTLHDSLPVALNSETGSHTYAIEISGLGEYYDTIDVSDSSKTDTGRIWGDDTNLIKTFAESKCIREDSVISKIYKGNYTTFNNGAYVCAYNVNCPDCVPGEKVCYKGCTPGVNCPNYCPNDNPDDKPCIPGEENCPNGNPKCPDCPVEVGEGFDKKCTDDCPVVCENCIYYNGLNILIHPMSLYDINPTNRELGLNWNINTNTAIGLKASAAIAEITNLGEKIYDTNDSDNSYTSIKFKLNADNIGFIKKYNKGKIGNDIDNYLSNDLECYDYKVGDITYEDIFCYSKFIDEFIEKYPDDIEIICPDGSKNNNCRTSKDDRSKPIDDSYPYWTTWTEYAKSNDKWYLNDAIVGMNIDNKFDSNYYNNGIGPSYK